MSTLGALVKSSRRRKGLSQEDLARAVEKTVATINRIENNKTVPELGTLKRIAEVVGLPFEKVLGVVEGELVPVYLPRDQYEFLMSEAARWKQPDLPAYLALLHDGRVIRKLAPKQPAPSAKAPPAEAQTRRPQSHPASHTPG